ncbi:MAG: deaminated glutathione amidase [Nocardioidaceae bacterium]
MKIAAGQFAASERWEINARTCGDLIEDAASGGAGVLVLPEGVLARFTDDLARIRAAAQPLDGPFVQAVAEATKDKDTTVVVGIHERLDADRVFNTLVVLRDGQLVTTYRKLHLYDAFDAKESANVAPGNAVPELLDCQGFSLGLMTCYDIRFPELARLHALAGADALLVPAAWVKGPGKERHWEVMLTARALENTCYVVAAGECGQRNVGSSMVLDPLGVAVSRLAERPGLCWADLDKDRLAEARRQLPLLDNRRFSVDPQPHDRSAISFDGSHRSTPVATSTKREDSR